MGQGAPEEPITTHVGGIDSHRSRPSVTAAVQVVEALVAAGVDHAFTVPGESFLPVLDALYDEPRIRTVTTRHEGGAAFMAEAYAKITNRLTACLATRAVGAANLSIGLHTAQQDSSPVIALLGQVASDMRYRESFQETNLELMLGPLTKWTLEPATAASMGELTYRAARVALEGRPGPVALSYHEDLLSSTEVEPREFPRLEPAELAADPEAVTRAVDQLRKAHRPLILAGADVLATRSEQALVSFADAEEIPVVASWRRPDVFPNDHRLYLGHAGLSVLPSVTAALRDADVVLVLGCRMDENTTAGYTLPSSDAVVIHVYNDLGRLSPTNGGLAVAASTASFLQSANAIAAATPLPQQTKTTRASQSAKQRRAWEADRIVPTDEVADGFLDQFQVVASMNRLLPAGTVVTTDAGNFSGWGSRHLTWNEPRTFLGPVSGAMGYALPAAIGASLARPDRKVVGLAGDGSFLMTAAELQTAAREDIRLCMVVFDNAQYGTIRMWQQNRFPGRQIATHLGASDIALCAKSLGAWSAGVSTVEEFDTAFATALDHDGPAVVVVRTDPEQISVGARRRTATGA